MPRKYLHWGEQKRYALLGERREVPEAPRREPPHVPTDADIRKAAEEYKSLREKRMGR